MPKSASPPIATRLSSDPDATRGWWRRNPLWAAQGGFCCGWPVICPDYWTSLQPSPAYDDLRHLPRRVGRSISVSTVVSCQKQGLPWLVAELDRRPGKLDKATISRLLTEANLTINDVAPFVEQRTTSYARRCVARRDNYELLVLTWLPSQGSVAHDHSGCLCGLKVVQGCLTEQLFQQGPDGQVRRISDSQLQVGGITVDPGVVIHSLTNDASSPQALVTVHIYAPPLPEVRRYAVTSEPPAKVFVRAAAANAQTVAIVGGGFTGTMCLANLLRLEKESRLPMHIVLIDRLPAIGEGVAYRTNDGRHLLNVPAGRMSAWADRPDDFLQFMHRRARL